MVEQLSSQTTAPSLADKIIEQVDSLIGEAEAQTKPLEVDPYRGQLFELFVLADGAGYLEQGAKCDLSADALCRELSRRWGLTDAAQSANRDQTPLAAEHLSKMRLLWSVMRMWMEWSYAWQRWTEFHPEK